MNIGIIGLGLMGGSMAKALRKYTDHVLYGMDTDPSSLEKAKQENAIYHVLSKEALAACDLVVIALYPKAALAFLEENRKRFKRGAVVTDLCGIKCEICALGTRLGRENHFTFVGGHPMAGKEVWGFDSADAELFCGASMILTPDDETPDTAVFELAYLYQKINFSKMTITTPQEHDAMIAYTSQLAHILSSAYVKSPASRNHAGYSAGSFKDLTRVASLNEIMWSDIFIMNKRYLVPEIDLLITHLEEYKQVLLRDEKEELVQLLDEGNRIKRAL